MRSERKYHLEKQKDNIESKSRQFTLNRQGRDEFYPDEENLQFIFRNIQDVFLRTDMSGTIVLVSPQVQQILGYQENELLGENLIDDLCVFDGDKTKLQNYLQHPDLRQNLQNFITCMKRKDDLVIWTSFNFHFFQNDEGAIIGLEGTIQDVTEREKREEELNLKLASIVESSQDAIIGKTLDGTIISWNPGAEKIYGYSEAEVMGKHISILVPPNYKQELQSILEKIKHGENVALFETKRMRKDGKEIDVSLTISVIKDKQGNIIGSSTIARDISSHKKALKSLQESEERYRKFFEEDLTGDFISTGEGKILECNPAFARMVGFKTVADVVQTNIFSFFPKPEIRDQILNQLQQEKKLELFKTRFSSLQGKTIHVIANIIGIFDEQGELKLIKGYLFDITDRIKLEQQLLQSQKMEAIGQFAGGIAHDFNNLLTVIRGYSELLLNEINPDNPILNDLGEIKKAGDRAASLTNQLLSFSRKQVVQPRTININDTIGNLKKMLKRIIGEDIELITLLHPEIARIKIDPAQIEQIIMNLAVNARNAMPHGGKLIVQTDNIQLDQVYSQSHVNVTPGDYVMLAVSDNGIGIDHDLLSRIFEPFFTTKKPGKGTGMGLSMVYGIVRQNNGYISTYSEPNQGTIFKIYFPKVEQGKGQRKRRLESMKKYSGSETILVVEDEDVVRNLIFDLLTKYGYRVLIARNGEEALNIGQQQADKIDLLLTDVVLPQMNGRETAERLFMFNNNLLILFMSGYTDDTIINHGVLESDAEFIPKPFVPIDLLKKLRQMLDNKASV